MTTCPNPRAQTLEMPAGSLLEAWWRALALPSPSCLLSSGLAGGIFSPECACAQAASSCKDPGTGSELSQWPPVTLITPANSLLILKDWG